jgi:hypothetical protein
MEAKDWLKGVEKRLVITQCTDREKVLFAVHQLFGTVANWWETYCYTSADVDSIKWNEFKAHFVITMYPRHHEAEEEGIHRPETRQYDSE